MVLSFLLTLALCVLIYFVAQWLIELLPIPGNIKQILLIVVIIILIIKVLGALGVSF